MKSKNEIIKDIIPRIICLADKLYPVYMPTDENGYCGMDYTTLFGHGMDCFGFSTARLCYIAALRKLFMAAFIILVREGLVDIDLSDIKNMSVDTYWDMICLDRLGEESELTDILIKKVFDAYGYRYSMASYKMDDLAEGIDDMELDEVFKEMESNCDMVMQENDRRHMNIYNLFCQAYQTEWYEQDDIKVWRFYNRWLTKILNRDYELTSGSEREVLNNVYRLDYLFYPDEVSFGMHEYSMATGDFEFAAVESAYVSSDWYGCNEYWCRLDSAFLNFGALLTIPYIDALLDDIDLQ